MFSCQTVNPKFKTMHLKIYRRFILTTIMIADELLNITIFVQSWIAYPLYTVCIFTSKQIMFSYLFEAFAN